MPLSPGVPALVTRCCPCSIGNTVCVPGVAIPVSVLPTSGHGREWVLTHLGCHFRDFFFHNSVLFHNRLYRSVRVSCDCWLYLYLACSSLVDSCLQCGCRLCFVYLTGHRCSHMGWTFIFVKLIAVWTMEMAQSSVLETHILYLFVCLRL